MSFRMRRPSQALQARLLLSVMVAAMLASDAFGGSPGLQPANDLASDVGDAQANARPVLVLYSQAGCTWCEESRRYIVPLATGSETRDKAIYRQVNIDADTALTDFGGRNSSHRAFAQARKVSLTPTVVLYGPDGQMIGEPIVGMRLPDFYGQYLLSAIESAQQALEARK